MIELREDNAPQGDVEALVRLAGDYVRASDDLRPRVLETARIERGERRARRRIWEAGLCVFLMGLFVTSLVQRFDAGGALRDEAASQAAVHAPHEAAAKVGDGSWGMVESFTELRRRQAELLRLAL